MLMMMLIFSLFAIEENKPLVAEHGNMRVVYSMTDFYHIIKVLKKTEEVYKGKKVYHLKSKVPLDLKEGEFLSMDKSFECYGKDKTYAYGIITKKIAHETQSFSPLRAWLVNEKEYKLERVVNPDTIKCKFEKGEETSYPFKGQ